MIDRCVNGCLDRGEVTAAIWNVLVAVGYSSDHQSLSLDLL